MVATFGQLGFICDPHIIFQKQKSWNGINDSLKEPENMNYDTKKKYKDKFYSCHTTTTTAVVTINKFWKEWPLGAMNPHREL